MAIPDLDNDSVVHRKVSRSGIFPVWHRRCHLGQPSWSEFVIEGPSPRHPANPGQHWLDSHRFSLKIRARGAFWFIAITQGAWWIWITALVTRFRQERPVYDWSSPGFGAAFAVYIFLTIGFQLNYLFL